MRDHRTLAHALLRITVGLMFFLFGAGKLRGGLFAFSHAMIESFADVLPAALVKPFATLLPFAEITIGLLLIAGLFVRPTLAAASLLMMALVAGIVLKPDPPTAAHNITYALVLFVLLFTADHDGWSMDEWRRRS